jgi:hypothetical protein
MIKNVLERENVRNTGKKANVVLHKTGYKNDPSD